MSLKTMFRSMSANHVSDCFYRIRTKAQPKHKEVFIDELYDQLMQGLKRHDLRSDTYKEFVSEIYEQKLLTLDSFTLKHEAIYNDTFCLLAILENFFASASKRFKSPYHHNLSELLNFLLPCLTKEQAHDFLNKISLEVEVHKLGKEIISTAARKHKLTDPFNKRQTHPVIAEFLRRVVTLVLITFAFALLVFVSNISL